MTPSRRDIATIAAQLLAVLAVAVIATGVSVDYSAAQQPRTPTDTRDPQPVRPHRQAATPKPDVALRQSTQDRNERLGRDTFGALGGNSPFCKRPDLGARERRNCRGSGSLAHPVRIDHYGFDIRIDTGIDNIGGNFAYALQYIASLLWMGWLYLIKGVLLLLEWAFSLDLLDAAMGSVKKALNRLNTNVLGQQWFLAAISAAGLWAIYSGFVRRRTIATVTGLAATAGLMLVALVLIHDPAGTAGRASSYANQASLSTLAGASTGSTSSPARGFGEAMTRTFDQAVLRPWCALEFSDIDFCLASPRKVIKRSDMPGDADIQDAYEESRTVAEMFLRFEANGRDDVDQRNKIYEEWKDKDGTRLQAVVRVQKEASTGPRIALLALISIAFLGMILLLGWVGLRLLGYAAMSLVLILFAPVGLLLAALGDSGRATTLGWLKRLAGALIAKFVYAIFLALALVAGAALTELESIGYLAVWLLQAVFWWLLFLKRDELLQFVQVTPLAGDQGRGSLSQRLFRAQRHVQAARAIGAAAGLAVAAPASGALSRVASHENARAQSVRTAAHEQARRRAHADLSREHEDAQKLLERDRAHGEENAKLDRLLARYDERALTAAANGSDTPKPTEGEAALLKRRDQLAADRPSRAQVAAARELARHADVNRARTGAPISPEDEAGHLERRREELAGLAVDDDRNLRAAGIDPREYRNADAVQRESLHRRAAAALDRERVQLDVVGDLSRAGTPQSDATPDRAATAAARRTLDRSDVRRARQKLHDQRRAERRAQRTRSRLAPPKRR